MALVTVLSQQRPDLRFKELDLFLGGLGGLQNDTEEEQYQPAQERWNVPLSGLLLMPHPASRLQSYLPKFNLGSPQEIEVDVKVIVATKGNLREAVKKGTFQEGIP